MNCNLVIANNFSNGLKDIKDLSEKSRLLLKNGPAYQYDLSRFALGFYRQGTERNWTDLHFLSFLENINCYSWKYKFYDIKDNLIKDCKIFSPYMQFLNKGLSFQELAERKKYVIIEYQGKNIVSTLKWDWWNFDFNLHYRDQNLIFVLDRSTGKFATSVILIALGETINKKSLNIDKRSDINCFLYRLVCH